MGDLAEATVRISVFQKRLIFLRHSSSRRTIRAYTNTHDTSPHTTMAKRTRQDTRRLVEAVWGVWTFVHQKKNLPRTDTIFILITWLLFILQTYSPFYYFITYFRELLFNGYYLEKLSWFFQIRNGTSVDIVRMSYKIGVIR